MHVQDQHGHASGAPAQVSKGILAGVLIPLLSLCLVGSAAARGTAAQPSLRVSPGVIVPNEKIYLAGNGFKPGEAVLFYWGGSLLARTVNATTAGSFSGVYEYAPAGTHTGIHYIKATGTASKLTTSVAVTVPAPALVATPMQTAPRARFAISASGFGAYEQVGAFWNGNTLLGAPGKTNRTGAFSSARFVPANTAGGAHVVLLRGLTTGRVAQVTIQVSALAPTATPIQVGPTSTPVPAPALAPAGPPVSSGVYHFSGSLVASAGAQVSHVDGILTLQVGANGALGGSVLRLNTGETIPVGGSGAHGLALTLTAQGLGINGQSTAAGPNRLSGLFTNPAGGTNGFWVATRVAPAQMGVTYAFSSKIESGPDANTTYDGTLQLYGDTYGGLLGYLTLKDGTLLRVDGQSVNGNVNMLIVVRAGTPLFASGTMSLGGNFHGTIAGPLAGDQGSWTATK